MMNFTQTNFKKQFFLLLALVIVAGSTLLNAQSHIVTVNTPPSVAGSYTAQIAAFGPLSCDVSMVSGDLAIVSDTAMSARGCGSISTDLTGKIAVIDRGVCGFNEKAYNAQLKGAIAVIVVNNTAAAPAIFSMAGAAPFNTLTTIPAFMISLADGNKIKAALAGGVNITVTRNDIVDESNDIVVWGNNSGEGDFAGGLNEWTVVNSTCANAAELDTWTWSANGTVRGSCGGATIASPTYCNGAAVFESDFLDSGTGGCGSGGGACGAAQFGELLSPIIDVSASNAAGYSLKFYQLTRQFQSAYFVTWSIDGGASWVDTTEINTDLVANAAATNNNVVRVALTGTSGASSIRVKFIYDANYYYWGIDDVKLIEQEAFNLSVNNFFAVTPNAATPLAHVEPIYFLADVGNLGAVAQDNVNLNVTVEYRAGAGQPLTEVFSATLPYGTVAANSTDENRVFPQTFTPTQVGTYFVTYTVSSDNADFDSTNNAQEYAFFVTQNIFAKDLLGPVAATNPSNASWADNEPHAWAWGVHYYVPNAAGNYIQSLSFGIQPVAAAAGQDMVLAVYKWIDADGDEVASPTERELLGLTSYTIKGTEVGTQLITVPFPFEGDDPVQLEDNTHYLVMVEYLAADQTNVAISYSNDLDYFATATVLGDATGNRRYAGIIAVGGDLSVEDYAPSGFSGSVYTNIPVVRMQVGATPTSAKDLSKLDSEFVVFPNPTSDAVNLQLNLTKQAQTATVRLFDISGKLLQQWNYDNVQNERYQYRVNNLSSGTYFMQVVTEEGAGTKKFTVSK